MPWYEKEDLEKAREMTAIEYLKRYESQRLKPCRGLRHEYELTDHDSFKINEITSQCKDLRTFQVGELFS